MQNRTQIYYLSDMMTGDGEHIIQSALNGIPFEVHNNFKWPNQGAPSARDWTIWKTACSTHLLILQCKLKTPLGQWLALVMDKTWLYNPADDRLFKQQNRKWKLFNKIPSRTRKKAYQYAGYITPKDILRAMVHKSASLFICSGVG
jgi:hypothetical protein